MDAPFPPLPVAPPKRVLVIGAGMSGVLQLYQEGELAVAMDGMDDAGRAKFALPVARGAYGGRTPGQNFLLRDHGATPEGRLFFAGEHVSLEYPGWIEGALRTGFRAAEAVNALARS